MVVSRGQELSLLSHSLHFLFFNWEFFMSEILIESFYRISYFISDSF